MCGLSLLARWVLVFVSNLKARLGQTKHTIPFFLISSVQIPAGKPIFPIPAGESCERSELTSRRRGYLSKAASVASSRAVGEVTSLQNTEYPGARGPRVAGLGFNKRGLRKGLGVWVAAKIEAPKP